MSKKHIKVDPHDILSYDKAIEYLHIDKDEELFVGLLNKFKPSIYTLEDVEEYAWFLAAVKLTRKSRFLIEDDSLWIYEDMTHKKLLHSTKEIMPWDECTECYFLKDDILRLRKDYNNLLKDLFIEHDENIYSKSLRLGLENKALKSQLEQLQLNNDELGQKIEALNKQIDQLQAGKKEKAAASGKEEIASSSKPTIAAVIRAILEIDSIDELHEFQACFRESGSAKSLEYFILDKKLKKSNDEVLKIGNDTARKLIRIVKNI